MATPGPSVLGVTFRGTSRAALLPAILLLGLLLRVLAIGAGRPYISYEDEGHVLHPAMTLLKERTWDPGWYRYPTLSIYLIAGAATAAGPAFRAARGVALPDAIPDEARKPKDLRTYDRIAPFTLVLLGRLVTLAASLGLIYGTFLLAARIAGDAVGLGAALLAAITPAVVVRSAVVMVDPLSACFCVFALVLAARLAAETKDAAEGPGRTLVRAFLGGALSGLAFTSKYTGGAVLVAVLVAVFGRNERWPGRVRAASAALAGFALAALVAMPALVLRSERVLDDLRTEARLYASAPPTEGLLRSSTRSYELGPVLPFVSLAGVVTLFARRRTRAATVLLVAFAAVLLGPLLVSAYRPFRNVLPLLPIAFLGASEAIVTAIEAGARRSRALSRCLATVGLLLAASLLGQSWYWQRLQARVRDSRVEAVDWLASATREGQRLLLAQEISLLPSEVARIPATVTVLPWASLPSAAAAGGFDWVVTTDVVAGTPWEDGLRAARGDWERWAAGRAPAATFGSRQVHPSLNMWRDRDARVVVYRAPRAAVTDAAGARGASGGTGRPPAPRPRPTRIRSGGSSSSRRCTTAG